ncbi:MAG TPA: hypothetical protein VD968_05540 [Pyrinomonadaceae bacterium]|nr:hypothetical protein [Pyrinomonadaceae bacterium]
MPRTGESTGRGGGGQGPPALRRDSRGRVEPASLADLIQWFLDYDRRVAVVRFPAVEHLFRLKQAAALAERPDAVEFASAEDRLAVGVMQALVEHDSERELHAWVRELLGALDDATKTNEAIAESYGLRPGEGASVVEEAEKIPSAREREVYLTCCWLETLCTAEIRVLGWAYRELYGRPFHPDNF